MYGKLGAAVFACLLLARAAFAAPAPLHWKPVGEPGVGGAIVSIEVCPTDPNRILLGGDILGASLSTDGGQTWGGTFGFHGWEMGDSTWSPVSPATVWMATMSGPYKSTDGGKNWMEQRTGFPAPAFGYSAPLQKILYDPNSPKHLMAFGGSHRRMSTINADTRWGAIWNSADDGKNWTLLTTLHPDDKGRGDNILTAAFAAKSSAVLFAAVDGKGVWKSVDAGKTWAAANTGLPSTNVNFLAVHPVSPKVLWAALGNGGGVCKSADGGATWKDASAGLDVSGSTGYDCIVVSPSNPKVLYTGSYNAQKVYKSTDGGLHWARIMDAANSPPQATPFAPQPSWLAVSPMHSGDVYAMNWVNLLKSTDGGAHWTDSSSYPPDAGNRWHGRGFSGFVCRDFQWNPYRPAQAFFQAMDDGKMWQSLDNLRTWKWAGAGVPRFGGGTGMAFGADGKTVYACFGQFGGTWLDDGVYKTTDGGLGWTKCAIPDGVSVSAGEMPDGVWCSPQNPAQVWCLFGGKLWSSQDSGHTWARVPVVDTTVTPNVPDAQLYRIVGDPKSPLTIYVSGRGGVYKSTDGKAFSLMAGSPQANEYAVTTLTLDPSDPSTLYACNYNSYHNRGLYRCKNGAWQQVMGDYLGQKIGSCYALAVDPANGQHLALATNEDPFREQSGASGVWLSEDGGQSWTQQNDNLPMLRINVIQFSPDGKTLVAGLNGRGFYKAAMR